MNICVSEFHKSWYFIFNLIYGLFKLLYGHYQGIKWSFKKNFSTSEFICTDCSYGGDYLSNFFPIASLWRNLNESLKFYRTKISMFSKSIFISFLQIMTFVLRAFTTISKMPIPKFVSCRPDFPLELKIQVSSYIPFSILLPHKDIHNTAQILADLSFLLGSPLQTMAAPSSHWRLTFKLPLPIPWTNSGVPLLESC